VIKLHTEIIKKSKFIGYIYDVEDEKQIKKIIENLKKENKKATHITYAYIIDNKEKYFDDAEPKGTAGLPILTNLKRNNLNNILLIVVRYYGGIKLGAGGLIRAYSKTASNTIKKAAN